MKGTTAAIAAFYRRLEESQVQRIRENHTRELARLEESRQRTLEKLPKGHSRPRPERPVKKRRG